MDFQEQSDLALKVEKFPGRELKGKEFEVVIAVEEEGTGFAFSTGTLNDRSAFQSCKLIVNAINNEARD